MNTYELRKKIMAGAFDKDFSHLAYLDVNFQKMRYLNAIEEFEKIFGERESVLLFSTPGRTELSGNHTDHQGGCVLAGSVNLDTIAVVSKRDDKKVTVASFGYEPFTIDLESLEKKESEQGQSEGIVRGVAAAVAKSCACRELCGFDAYTTSDVPKGSGLSSSAAFEVLIGKIFSYFCADNALTDEFLAEAGFFSEFNYFGKPCGKMDQYACAMGGIVFIDFKDSKPEYKKLDVDFEALGYTLVITSAGGSHAHLTHEYAAITDEMREISRYFGKEKLSQIDRDLFWNEFPSLRAKVSDRAMSRALHYFTEIERVNLQLHALEEKDIDTYLECMQGSGDSSLLNLQNIYPASDISERSLSLALGFSKKLGAVSRVHGGGFAGTIQALIKNEKADFYIKEMKKLFGDKNVAKIAIRPVGSYVIGEAN